MATDWLIVHFPFSIILLVEFYLVSRNNEKHLVVHKNLIRYLPLRSSQTDKLMPVGKDMC